MFEYVPTAPESLPTAMADRACSSRIRSRSACRQKSPSFAPKVVGSACMPWVRPTVGVVANSVARTTQHVDQPAGGPDEEIAGAAERHRQRGVDDVGRGQPVMDPHALRRPDGSAHDVDERGEVVVRHPLTFGDGGDEGCVDPRRRGARRGGDFARHGTEVRPALESE